MCDGYCWIDEKRNIQRKYRKRTEFNFNCDNLVWLTQGESITFYKAFGKNNCLGFTPWCIAHCYMNNADFIPELREKINNSYEMPSCEYFSKTYLPPFHEDMQGAKYITFFGSGSVNCKKDVEFINWVTRSYKDKQYRIFVRDLYRVEEFYGHSIIFSVDKDTNRSLLGRVLKDKNINIAVLNHPDNAELIAELKSKMTSCVSCVSCLDGNINTKHLCFKNEDRILVLENYETMD